MPDNKHIDIDPYGEEIWEDDDGYSKHYLSESGIYPGRISPDIFTKTVSVEDHCISSTIKRSQIEDIKAATGMDVVAELERMLVDELTKEIAKDIEYKIHGYWDTKPAEIKRTYSELDPYGEENWEE